MLDSKSTVSKSRSRMSCYYLVLLETSGNQNYIFSTNRLRENIGASELTYQAGTKWILEAVSQLNDATPLEVWKDSQRLRELLQNRDLNPPIENQQKPVEILTAASGKALLLTQNQETAQQIITDVTRKAVIEAPGLDVMGVYEEVPVARDFQNDETLAAAIKQIHAKFERARSRRPSPESRFLRLPIIAECAESGLPASSVDHSIPNQATRISKVSQGKRSATQAGINRLQNIIHNQGSSRKLIQNINKLEKHFNPDELPWLAVVHADGNGLGQIFLNFQEYIGNDKSNRNYIEQYRQFSLTLDQCTEAAFTEAIEIFPEKNGITPVVPLIIGGDDLTVVCDGQYALEFTREFLKQFEQQIQTYKSTRSIAERAFEVERLSACAGVAVVKRHFPFSVAYELAENLIKSAKTVKNQVTKTDNRAIPFPCSAIDFHILYDTSGAELGKIREALQPNANTLLYNRPYVVTPL
ncbi:MAG: hypothetical protein RI580_12365, partial [Halothece sp. Uz-M2-17]|nr:hypothetical protein [Halothece sp. Uz-M2-17]